MKNILILIGVYILLLAAMCPWPYQVAAYRLFIAVTVIMTSISFVLVASAREQVSTALERIRKEEPGYEPEKWRGYKKRISITYLPAVILLILAGSWFLAIAWAFMFLTMYGIAGAVVDELKTN